MRKLEEDDCLEVAESVVKPKSKRQATPKSGDDDLTSLTWLQDKNLLKGIHLHTPVVAPELEVSPNKAEPKEPEVKDSLDIEESACPGVANPPIASANTSASVNLKHPFNVPYDPQVHVASKPPFSFSCLIFMSIEGSPRKALPVKDIYNWIVQHFPYYRDAPNGWKNSVRHNLSLNKCFRKVEKAPNVGKGSLWMVDAHFRPNLLHALEKAPYSFSRALKCTTGEDSLISHHSPTSDDNDDELSSEEVSEELNDVGAAAAMMVLKHGPRASELYPSLSSRKKKSPAKKSKLTEINSPNTSSKLVPIQIKEELEYKHDNEDFDYDAYADEAYAADEESNSSMIVPKYSEEKSMKDEERRKIEEGADALLNLAGITTSFTKNNNNYNFINNNSDSRLIFKSHNNSMQHTTNGNEEENYKPRFIRRNHSHTKTSLKRKDISSNKVDNQKIQLSEKYDKPNKGKKIKLVKKSEKSKR